MWVCGCVGMCECLCVVCIFKYICIYVCMYRMARLDKIKVGTKLSRSPDLGSLGRNKLIL